MKFADIKIGDVFKFGPRGATTYEKTSDKFPSLDNAGSAKYHNQPNLFGREFFVMNDEIVELEKK